jgi:hypothetical protein
MWRYGLTLTLVGVLALGVAHAKDIVSMPEGITMEPQEAEIAYIYWDLNEVKLPNGKTALDYAHVFEAFVGLDKHFELDLIHVSPQGSFKTPGGDPFADVTELNLYVKVRDETPTCPGLTVGATNLLTSPWLPSTERNPDTGYMRGDRRISPFVVTYKTVRPPKGGPPSWNNPAIRLQLGYGWNYHEDRPYGILQFAFTPSVVAAVQYYNGQGERREWGWLVGWNDPKGWGLHVGALGGNPWVHANYDFRF